MLEVFCDAHTHFVSTNTIALCCAVNRKQWEEQESSVAFHSFGVHPLDAQGDISFLCTLLDEDKIDAVGEAGFDFRAKGSRQDSALVSRQESLWQSQLELAIKYNKPLVVHCVHAMDYIFRYTQSLSSLRSVVFHAFSGTSLDARSLLRRGVNAYFSFGARLAASRKTADCAASVPLERLLLETDSLDEQKDIREVYNMAGRILSIDIGTLCETIQQNFFNAMSFRYNFVQGSGASSGKITQRPDDGHFDMGEAIPPSPRSVSGRR